MKLPPLQRLPRPDARAIRVAGAALLTLLLLALLPALLGRSRPAAAAPPSQEPGASVLLTLTVGASPDSCSAEKNVTVANGMPVYLCYTAQNTGSVTFTRQILSDSSFTLVREFNEPLPAGTTVSHTLPYTPTASMDFTGVWAAITGTTQVQDDDLVNIVVKNPDIGLVQTVGTSATECGSERSLTVPTGTTVYFCLTLSNVGDVEFATHEITLPALGITGTVATRALPTGGTIEITTENAGEFGLPALSLNATSAISSTARIASRSADGFRAPARADASVRIGTSTVSSSGYVHTTDNCRNVSTTTLSLVNGTSFFLCFRVTNTGAVPLQSHRLSITNPYKVSQFSYALAPGASLVITNGVLSSLGAPTILGPYTVTGTINNTIALTSTNTSGFRTVTSAAVSVVGTTPTPTLTNTPTPIPPTSTWTPSPTWTPFPTQTPWPATPTFTPFPTPIPPTPTPTRSFELSNLATPTPNAEQAAALNPPPPPPADPLNSPLAPPLDVPPQPQSPLTTTGEGIPGALVPPEIPLDLTPTATPSPSPSATPSATPSHTPRPTETPTPTVTPTATQRPVVYPTPAPPPDLTGLFGSVLDATLSMAGLLFVLVAAIAFFGVAGAIVGMGFLRAGRRRYELYDLEPIDHRVDGDDRPAPPRPSGPRPPTRKPTSGPGAADNWPASLP